MLDVINDMIKVGKKLAVYRLIDGASGNMSYRIKDLIVITKTGAILDELTPKDFVVLRINENSERASSDLNVHKAVYMNTDYRAILHCHGIYNVILSFINDEIKPIDLEGRIFLKKVEVVEGEFGSDELAEKIADRIKRYGIVVVRGHGIYSAGKSIHEAFNKACYLEHSCEILYKYSILER